MRLVRRFTTGLRLTRSSLQVLRRHPTLVAFPLVGGSASLLLWVGLYVAVFTVDLTTGWQSVVGFFGVYFATTFVAAFVTAGLVASVGEAFHGREPTLRAGLAAAWEKRRPLAVWAAISAFVGVVLRSLERSESLLSRLVGAVFAVGWTIATLFVVPVIVFEDVSARGLFARSAATFRGTWGETLGSNFGIGLLQFVVWLGSVAAVVAVGVGLFGLVPWVGTTTVLVGVAAVSVGVYLVGRTVQGIVKTALYVYATEGTVPQAFATFDFETLDGRTESESDEAESTAV
ncbi:DUF6159 family protein [Halohasta salina]|uniref:DUF6159 family protein n=1 Tax=Halohasta salina TaxID=2961621 RepID=UPI0020A4A35A|nr:DUF6159 family protein [Halohasta salina]